MDIEKLETIIMSNDWGACLASGDHFYRLLFRYEKKDGLSEEETNNMFASYKSWKQRIGEMIKECNESSTMEDRKAITYAETLNEDILNHILTIISTVKCNGKNILSDLVTKVEDANKMKS